MSDIFEETEENLRADKWVNIAQKAWPWVSAALGLALVIALGVWAYQSYQEHKAAKASDSYEAALEAGGKNDKATAIAKFQETVKAGNPAYKALALGQLGAIALSDNKPDEAVKDFDEASKASNSPLLSDTAALRAAWIAMDKASYADIDKRLEPLMKDGRPVATLAKETLAMAKLQNGDVKGARADLEVIALSLGSPDGVRQRAQAEVMAIDAGAYPTAKTIMSQPEAQIPLMQMPSGAGQQADGQDPGTPPQ